MSWRRRLRAMRIDVAPLRTSRDFRLLFFAGTVFYLGGMVSYVAIPFQIYRLTGSNFAVGAIGLAEVLPLIVLGLYGGALADHVDRRRLLIWTGVAQVLFTAVLAWNAFRERPSIGLVFVVAALLAGAGALQRPSREALMPRTVRHDQIPAANVLSGFGMQIGVLAGPALAGLLLASVGTGWCFVVDVAGLVVATLMYVLMRPYPHIAETTPPSLRSIAEGWRYAVRRKDLLGTYLIDITAMLLAFPVVLFPALAQDVFVQPQLLGLLYVAQTVGAMLATLLSGWTSRVHHHGRAIVISAACYGLFIGLVGLAPTIWAALAFLVLAGVADMISGVFRSTVWNQTIPEQMRGRLAGIEMLSYSLGPMGGQVRAGLMADLWSVRASIATGGFACVAGVAITAALLRDFWRYDERTDPFAIAERELRASRGEQVG